MIAKIKTTFLLGIQQQQDQILRENHQWSHHTWHLYPTTITYGADCAAAFRTQACLTSAVPHATFALTTGICGMQCTASVGEHVLPQKQLPIILPQGDARGMPGPSLPLPRIPQVLGLLACIVESCPACTTSSL